MYANEGLVNEALAVRILEAADHPLAFNAFLSILFAPKAAGGGLDDMLRRYSNAGGRLLLLYGREDPWYLAARLPNSEPCQTNETDATLHDGLSIEGPQS